MTAAERRLWLAMRVRLGQMTPAMNKALLDAFENVTKLMSFSEIEIALANPDTFAELVFDQTKVELAFAGLREEIARQTRDAMLWYTPRLPGAGLVQGVAAISFDILDPAIVEAIRQLDSRVMLTLREAIRETFREVVRDGLERGLGTQTIARRVRASVGLAPNQLRAIDAFKAALREGRYSKALGYRLRDRRFDRTLTRLRASKGALTAEQIERMAAAYRRKFLAWNANVNARTAANDAQRLGKHLATLEAIEAGLIDGSRLFSRWINSGDDRVREEHQDAPVGVGQTVVRFGEPYATGEVIPGELTFNCRCIKFDFVKPAAVAV